MKRDRYESYPDHTSQGVMLNSFTESATSFGLVAREFIETSQSDYSCKKIEILVDV